MKLAKKISLTVFAIAVFSAVLYFGVLFSVSYFVNLDNYKESFFQAIEKETGFKGSCEKAELKKGFGTHLKVHLYHTGVMYPDNSVFLQIKEADLTVKVLPLIMKKIEIKEVQLERPIINIELYKDFTTSIQKYASNKKLIKTNGFTLDKAISSVNCKNYKIKFKDDTVNKTFYLEGAKLNFSDLKTDKNSNIHGNLSIKDLSLNLGDILSKNNNAELVFKGNEVEINAVLHPSLKDTASISCKYTRGIKRSIDLNANAKNINLENLFKITGTVTKILNIENPLSNMSAKGLLSADFNIKSDFKKLESKGNARIQNASLIHKNLMYPVSNINANVNFNNNNIVIEKAVTDINKTPVTVEGTIKNDLTVNLKAFSSNLDVKSVVNTLMLEQKLPFSVKNGSVNFETKITGNLGNGIKTQSDIDITDLNFTEETSDTAVNLKKCIINLVTNNKKYTGKVTAESADLQYNKQPVKADKLLLDFDEKNIKIENNKIILKNSPVWIDGNVENYNSAPVLKLNFNGDIISGDIAEMFSQYINQPYKAAGKLNTNGNLELSNNNLKLKMQAKSDKDNYISYLVIKELLNKPSVTNIDIEAEKNLITLNNISLSQEKETKLKITGSVENSKTPVLKNVNVLIPSAITVNSNFFGGEEISLKSDLILNNSLKNPEIKGNVNILKYNVKKYLTGVKNAYINFSPENIRITAPDVIVNNSVFNVTADVVPDFKNITVSNMQINSMNLDLNSLFNLIQNEQNIFAKSIVTVKNGSATINNFKILDLKANDISSDFKIEKNTLKISNINAKAYSGYVTGNINYEFGPGILDIEMAGKNLNIKNSLYDLCKLEDNITGQADVNAHISMMTGPYNTVIKTLSGVMEFNARNGSMGTLGKFEHYLYAQNLLYHGLKNTTLNRLVETIKHDDTAHYNIADGKILFQNGYIITNNVHTQGDKMSLFVRGRYNILTNLANLDIYGRISDEISKKLGDFGDISISDIINGEKTEKNNAVMVVPANITEEIMPLYRRSGVKTNTFKVNVSGNTGSFNAINSFTWILPKQSEPKEITEEEQQEEQKQEHLPDFSEL